MSFTKFPPQMRGCNLNNFVSRPGTLEPDSDTDTSAPTAGALEPADDEEY